MFEVVTRLFDTTGFPPRKLCGDGWTPALVWMHVTSDLFIWLAYLSIPLVLLYFTRRRDLPFPRLFVLFALFILACGTTHFLDALIFEYPIYRFAGVMKLVTAVVSWLTVIALIPVIPRVMHAVSLAAQPGAVTKQHRALTDADAMPAESRMRGYIVGLLAGVLAVLVRAAVDPLIADDHIFVVALLAVVYVSWRYGFGPGVLCLCVGVAGYTYFFVEPRRSLYVDGFGNQLALALFFFCGAACAALGEAQRQAGRRARVALASAVAWSKDLEAEVFRRQTAEDALRASEGQLRAFYDNSPVCMGVVEPLEDDIRHVYDNRASCAFFGVGAEGTAGRRASELGTTPAVLQLWLSKYRQSAERRAAVHFEYEYQADGGRRWLSATVSPLDPDAGPALFCYVAEDVTARRRAEGDLRASEERFRLLTEAVPHVVWNADASGEITYFNHRWLELTALPLDRATGRGWLEAVHPDDRERVFAAWRDTVERAAPGGADRFQHELRLKDAHGGYRWFLSVAVPLCRADGSVDQWIGSMADIHDQKTAAETVRGLNEQLQFRMNELRSVLDAAPAAIWISHDPECRVVTGNRTADALLDRPAGANVSATPAAELPVPRRFREHTPDGRPIPPDQLPLQRAARDGAVIGADLRLVFDDGRVCDLLGNAVPLRGADGRVRGSVGVFVDVTERKRSEAALRESEARFRSMADSTPALVWLAEPDGRRTYFNRTWLEFTGRPMADQIGDGWADSIHPDDRERYLAAYTTALAAHRPFELEYRLRRHDGANRWVLACGVPRLDPLGRSIGFVGLCLDVTDRRLAVEQVAEANKFLEATIDAMSGHIAVLAPDGTILKVNEAWRRFGMQNGLQLPGHGVGTNYLDLCDVACPSGRPGLMSDGIRAVVRGAAARYQVEYPCHAPGEPRWFLMSVNRFPGDGPVRVVVSHENITARVQAELAIRESEAFRTSVFENSPDCLKILSLDGRVLEMNEGGCRLMEVDDFCAIRGTAWADLWPPTSVETVREAVTEARAGRVGRFQGFCPTARGAPKYWDVSVAAVPAADGTPHRIIAVSRDVTEQKRAEERVRQSEEQFRQLADSMPQIVFAARPDGTVDYFNRRWYEYTGFPTDAPEGEAGWAAVHDADQLGRVRDQWLHAVRTGTEYEIEYRLRRHDGAMRWHLGRALPVRDAAGDIVRWYGTNTDVHDAKLAADALRASNERFRLLTEAVPQMVWTADPRGEVTSFNHRWDEYTGASLAAGHTQAWANNPVHPEDADRVRAGWQLAVAQGAESYSAEFRLRRAADGEYRWMLSAAVPLRSPSGEVAEWVGSLTDIDDQKRQAHTLERMVRERTAELESTNTALTTEVAERKAAEDQVRTVAIELERSNGELEKFAYVASHDLQEPLRKIQAFGDRLKNKCRDQLSDSGKEYVDRMLSAAGRMRRLIDDLLTFSRVTTQKRPFSRLDLDKLVREVVSDLDVRIGQAGGTVRVGPLPGLDADPSQMRQLFQNLIANAVKFHRPGVPPVVEVWSEPAELPSDVTDGDPRPGFRLSVRDNGIGFDEKYRERIFDVFQRLHGRDEYEGTGVGLAICRKIAERHGGSITAHSREGEGATFVVFLPAGQNHTREATTDDD